MYDPQSPKTYSIFAAAALLAVGLAPQHASAEDICQPVPFDVGGFEDTVHQALGGLKGYSVAIAREGEVVAVASGGFAADGVDTPAPVSVDGSTPFNVGSTIKVVSAVGLLRAFEQDPSASVEEWLDRYIVDYFPEPWRDLVLDPSSPASTQIVAQVTFRDILQHRSGLEQGDTFIEDGIDPMNFGVPTYSNGNFSVIAYMMPYIVDPTAGAAFDLQFQGVTPTEGLLYEEILAPYFGQYMQDEIFDLVSVSAGVGLDMPYGLFTEELEPSCDHKQSYASTPYFRDLAWGTSGDVPLAGDIDDDGRDDLVVWRPSNGKWYSRTVEGTTITSGLSYGDASQGDVPLTGDVNADGHDDYIIFRDDTGDWYAKAVSGLTLMDGLHFGTSGDVPLVGNVGGNTADDVVVWRPSTGKWYGAQRNGVVLFSGITFGTSGDVPHLGDVDGDGVNEMVIWRPSTGEWFARDVASGSTVISGLAWGNPGDVSLVGDADGNGSDELMIFRPSTGRWYVRDASIVYFSDVYWGQGEVAGSRSLVPLVGDFGGDYKDKLALFRPSNGHWSAAGRRYSLGYLNQADLGPGKPLASLAEPPGCKAAGGYWLSSIEFAAWAAALSDGQLLSSGLVDDLHDPAAPNEVLGWRYSQVAPSFFVNNYGVTRYAWSDGADGNNFRAALVELPDGYYGVAMANDANVGGSGQLVVTLRNAIVNGWIEAVDLDCE